MVAIMVETVANIHCQEIEDKFGRAVRDIVDEVEKAPFLHFKDKQQCIVVAHSI